MFSGAVVSGRFQIEGFLSEGGFGQVYVAKDIYTQVTLASKVERLDCVLPLLAKESECLQELDYLARVQQKEFVPKFYGAQETPHFRFMLMELCGRNVRELKKSTLFDRFSVGTSLWILKNMLQAVEFMHRNGWIHRDVKPPNFCVSLTGPRRLILVDFGTSQRSHLAVNSVGFCGTERYVSLRTHNKLQKDIQSAHESDDLWALYYITVENMNSQLPWRRATSRFEIAYQKQIVQENPQVVHELVPHPWFPLVRPPSSLRLLLRLLAGGQFNMMATAGPYYQTLASSIERDFVEHNFNQANSTLDWEWPTSGVTTFPSVYVQPAVAAVSVYAYQQSQPPLQQPIHHPNNPPHHQPLPGQPANDQYANVHPIVAPTNPDANFSFS